MSSADSRGWRVALVPDSLMNPPAAAPDVLGLLEAAGYGVLQLPPGGDHRLLLTVIADQVAEYRHHGYAVLAIGAHGEPGDGLHWRKLTPLLRHRGVPLPPRHMVRPGGDAVAEGKRLSDMLAGFDLPLEEQQRWRVGG